MSLIYGIGGLLVLILDIYCILQVLGGAGDAVKKLLWILLILIASPIGAILYLLLGRSRAL